ncbi:MAG: rod shape-determining protein MreC, partial [Synergistota bacterium]|nr:rod shape-determining protein MreC [Synergistota bacterium]
VTSPELMVPVVVDETRDLGVAAGDGQGRVVLRHVPFETELRPGDTLSTALVGDDLPPGLPLGEISEIVEGGGFREYVVKTGAELSRLYGVYILVEGGASR